MREIMEVEEEKKVRREKSYRCPFCKKILKFFQIAEHLKNCYRREQVIGNDSEE